MKLSKILAGVLAGTMVLACTATAFAETTVSNTEWWDAWTPTYEITDGATITITADETVAGDYVYSSLNAAFVNVATDGSTTPSNDAIDGYAEYVVLRSDNYGWGDYYSGVTYTGTDYLYVDDDTDYKTLLTGAHYDITISRSGSTIQYDYVITESDGTVLNCGYSIDLSAADISNGVYVFFTGDAGVTLVFDADSTPAADDSTATETTDTTADTTTETTTDAAADTTTTTTTTQTGDVAPIAAVAVALIGCAVIVVASKKRFA